MSKSLEILYGHAEVTNKIVRMPVEKGLGSFCQYVILDCFSFRLQSLDSILCVTMQVGPWFLARCFVSTRRVSMRRHVQFFHLAQAGRSPLGRRVNANRVVRQIIRRSQ